VKPTSVTFFDEASRSTPLRLLATIQSPESGVQLWTAQLEPLSAADVVELTAPLDAAERARAARFSFERDRQHYLAARGLLRRLLGSALDRPAEGIVFEYGAKGKPAIAAAERDGRILRFNLSHSAGWVMFALAWDRNVGIDLEAAARLGSGDKDLNRLAASILSAREGTIWRAIPNAAARRVALLRAWTRKEAFVKATGEGVSDGFANVELILDAAAPKRSLTITQQAGEPTRSWALHDLLAPEGLAAALAIEQPG
jgi:4'-phosphopantetheinyl transferase